MEDIIAGMDIGFGQVKVCLKQSSSNIKKYDFPRIFAEATNSSWELNNHTIYGIGGERYFMGEDALSYQQRIIRHEYRDYVREKPYLLCIAKALKDLGIIDGNNNVRLKRLILGLAPGHYSKENIRHMRRRVLLGTEFTVNSETFRFSTENVKILPQGSGAFFAETLTDRGFVRERNRYKNSYGILDVGYRTTDFLVFENGQFISDTDELSEDTGIKAVIEKLQIYVKQAYDREELEYLLPLLKGQNFNFRGDTQDLSPIVNRLADEHIRKRIAPEVLKRWEGRLNRFHKIIICGGGAHFFRHMTDFLKDHQKQIFIPDEPEMMNAIGFCRYGAMQETLDAY